MLPCAKNPHVAPARAAPDALQRLADFGLVLGLRAKEPGHRLALAAKHLPVGCKRPARVARPVPGEFVRRAGGNHVSARVSPLGAQIDHPVRAVDDVEIVLDEDHAAAGRYEPPQHAHELADVVKVQPCRRLVEHEKAPGGEPARGGKNARELQALGFSPGKGRDGLAELDVAEPHILQRLQSPDDVPVRAEIQACLVHGHFEHVGDGHFAPAIQVDGHLADFRPVPGSAAVRAAQEHVAQKLHLHALEPCALAGRAAPAARIEAEVSGLVAALGGKRHGGENRADLRERIHVRNGIGARGLANRRLVDEHHFRDAVPADELSVRTAGDGLPECALQGRHENVAHERRFSRARHAGHHANRPEREGDVDVLEVVFASTFQGEPAAEGILRDERQARVHAQPPAQIQSGEGFGLENLPGRAVKDDRAALLARARSHIDDPVRIHHDLRIMLDNHERVALALESLHERVHPVHVPWVQADRRLVKHEQGVNKVRAECRREIHALHFAARERAALPVEREIPESHIDQIGKPRSDLLDHKLPGLVAHFTLEHVEEGLQPLDRQQHQVMNRESGKVLHLLRYRTHQNRHEATVSAF